MLAELTGSAHPAMRMMPLGVLSRYEQAAKSLADGQSFASLTERHAWRELCFCLLSPVTRFEAVTSCMHRLEADGILDRLATKPSKVRTEEIRRILADPTGPCRFPAQKAKRLRQAAAFFYGGERDTGILGFLDGLPVSREAREALVESVSGLGMKEASHFLRNVGRGSEVAILDVHVRRFLAEMGIVNPDTAHSNSVMSYLSMERTCASLAYNMGLDLAAMDLAIWEYMRRR